MIRRVVDSVLPSTRWNISGAKSIQALRRPALQDWYPVRVVAPVTLEAETWY